MNHKKWQRLCTVSAIACCISVSPFALAQDNNTKAKNEWDGSNTNLGLTLNTGTKDSSNLSLGSIVIYTVPRWNNNLNLNYQTAKADGTVSQNKFIGTDNFAWNFSDNSKSNVAANLNFTADEFSDYYYTAILGALYGRNLASGSGIKIDGQIGPAWRRNEVRIGKKCDNNIVAVIILSLVWQPNSIGAFTETARADIGKPYDTLRSTTSFVNKLTTHLAFQLMYDITYTSSIPPHGEQTHKTNSTTTANLVYNF